MKNANIGIANLIISNKLKDSYFNDKLIEESKKLAFDFFDVVKSSPILQLEFKIYNNIENKHIENDLIATRYIDNNIKLFEVYTIEEIEAERKKLNDFISESIPVDDKKVELYNAIDNLIRESLSSYENIDVDNIHESFTIVLNHIKEPKKMLIENVDVVEVINEDVIEIAVDKFNEKYNTMNEDDKTLLQTLIKSTPDEKKELLETFKNESLQLLESSNNENVKERIDIAIQNINNMTFNIENVDDNIINLYEFKKLVKKPI